MGSPSRTGLDIGEDEELAPRVGPNGKFRDECLSMEGLRSRTKAKAIVEA